MADYLLIFLDPDRMVLSLEEYIHYESLYKAVKIVHDAHNVQGFNIDNVDLLFLNGWWRNVNSGRIIDSIMPYMTRRDSIIGDKNFIPPCFYGHNVYQFYGEDINNRFEILDIKNE